MRGEAVEEFVVVLRRMVTMMITVVVMLVMLQGQAHKGCSERWWMSLRWW